MSDLHLPVGRATRAAAAVVHPHPAMGGDRHHPLVVDIAEGLAERGVAALRPDLRDADPAPSAARLHELAGDVGTELGTERLVLAGYSWGSVVVSLAAPPGLVGRVLVAPPVAMIDMGEDDGVPTLVLVPRHDQYGGPAPVEEHMGPRPDITIEVVEGTDHFLAGAVGRIANRTVDWIDALLGP